MLSTTSTYVKRYDGCAYVKSYDKARWIYFLIKVDYLLEKSNTIWETVSADMKKEFYSQPVRNKEFLKTKIKFYCDEVRDFYDKKTPKVDSNHTSLAVIGLDSLLKIMKTIIQKPF